MLVNESSRAYAEEKSFVDKCSVFRCRAYKVSPESTFLGRSGETLGEDPIEQDRSSASTWLVKPGC